MKYSFIFFLCFFLVSCQYSTKTKSKTTNVQKYRSDSVHYVQKIHDILAPFHTKMHTPEAGDWLDMHKEKGQTFIEYLKDTDVPLSPDRKWIIILPIGEFSPKQKEILHKAVRYMEIFYQLPSRVLPALYADKIPKRAKRENGIDFQLYTHYILDEVLLPKMQDSIASMLAFTSYDLYPHPKWSFVFGQASLVERTGVWSMNRFGDPDKNEQMYKTCLLHTIKTAIHEAGHIFGIKHCIAYECCMSGSNSLDESARRTVTFCPICTAKVGAHFQMNLAKQHKELAEFWKENNFSIEQGYYEQAGKALEQLK